MLLASPAIASKRWIFEQYDHSVRTNTLVGPGAGDAAVMRVKGTEPAPMKSGRALALATDCNGRWCALDPREGAKAAVAEAARNVACSGARPIAATNCLNFGNPEKPETMWQFSEAIDGIAEACAALDTPITGGNVSFYNETLGKPIFPTPVIGILGILDDASKVLRMGFSAEGEAIILLDGRGGPPRPPEGAHGSVPLQMEFSSSEYAKCIHGIVAGAPPVVDLAAEKKLIECLVRLASEGAVRSAHDVSDGGLAVTLAESCFAGTGGPMCPPDGKGAHAGAPLQEGLGADVKLDGDEPPEYALFGERGARAVVSCAPDAIGRVVAIARECGVAAREIGSVGRGEFRIEYNGHEAIHSDIAVLKDVWEHALVRALKGE